MRKKFFSRGFFGLALLMLFGLTLPTWGQPSMAYTITNEILKEQITDGKLIAIKANDANNSNYVKGASVGSPTFLGATTTFKVEVAGDKFRLKNVGANQYIKKPQGSWSGSLVAMTDNQSEAALFTANNVAKENVAWNTSLLDNTATYVRFVESVANNCFFNCQRTNAAPKWLSGQGGFSVFKVYEVVDNYEYPAFDENKPFRVISNRGTLTYDTERGKLKNVTGTGNDGDVNQKFAIITDDGVKYLYSYGAGKFVASDYYRTGNRLTTVPVYTLTKSNAQTPMNNYAYKLQLNGGGNNSFINLSEENVLIDHWTTEDEGNRFYLKNIEETVQSAEILKNAYNAAIATVKAQNDGVTVSEGTNLTEAKENWNTAKTQARLKAGFYRLQGPAGKYLTAGDKGAALTMGTTKGEQTIFYYNGESEKNLVALSNGYSLHNANLGGTPADGDALTIRVEDGDTYTLQGGETYLTHNTNNSVAKGNKQEKCEFRLESVAEIPVTLHNGEATFYTPVAVSVSEGTTAYKGSVSGSTLNLTALNGTIPANTPFFLKGTGDCTLTVTTGGETISDNAFTGSVKTRTQTSGKSTYVLSNAEFKLLGEGVNCRGFRAQVETETNSGVQGFTLEFDNITAIESVETPTDNTPVFDLSGRCVAKTVKGGIYLRNGKKFVQ
ncbi:hypothetical protein EII14_01580 [Alloprevotella sp. OH1205_COT-284]|uniref:hypothetical protein n=1 Tax=Alloprevotella sp. OH1205_COT-284 TaxID=2491043 RepID=UPI000F5F6CF2|nr:hypothetical protein [Alloprevotella sp. OH1205_COT-284]RRD80512.1 hypothetical protein EII14_01580 [Alloprevotella sp. OH1205_COT-284]